MHALWLAVLALSATPFGSSSQIPFSYHDDKNLWNLDEAPSQNSTSNFIFDTVNSLLQQWPNTRYRNGHTIVPATIPTGTLLYHGTYANHIPVNPEWVATDAEHARFFCLGHGTTDKNQGCWQLTLAVKQPLRIVYFDGSSSAKLSDGPIDSQDVLLWGKSRPDMLLREDVRICRLCDWGKKYGIHGFMRMQMDFEIMLCNFTKDVEVVSFLNLATDVALPPEALPDPSNVSMCNTLDDNKQQPLPPRSVPRNVLIGMGFDTVEVGTWHNAFPGDTRIIPDLSRVISFYDTELFPSLSPLRFEKERWDHRVDGLSLEDVHALRTRLDEMLADDQWGRITPVDWRAQFHVITNRYAERLEILQYIVTNITDTQRAADRAFDHLRKLLSPYRVYTATPPSLPTSSPNASNHSWAKPVFKLCTTTHTLYLSRLANLTPSETLLLHAMEDVNKEICRVLVKVWADGVEWRLVPWKDLSRSEGELRALLDGWKVEVDRLMKWLDWSVWVKCPEPCGPEEMCYMPTWPFFSGIPSIPILLHPVHMLPEPLPLHDTPQARPWHKPQPRCVRKIAPYSDLFT